MMNSRISLALVALVLAACQNGAPKIGPQVEERTADQVRACEFLGEVRAFPKIFGPLKSVAREDGERAAKKSAQDAGGNVVVFDPIAEDAEVFQVSGKAYRC